MTRISLLLLITISFTLSPAFAFGSKSKKSADSWARSYKQIVLTCEEARFVQILNLYRELNGLVALEVSAAGTREARWHAQDMIDKGYFSHVEPDGRDPFQRMEDFGYDGRAENIAYGVDTAMRAFCLWRSSPKHNRNMLNSFSKSLGI